MHVLLKKDQTPLFSEIMRDIHYGCSSKAKYLRQKYSADNFIPRFLRIIKSIIGSAKGNQKLIGVYYTLENFYAQYRSSVEHLRLLLLCKENNLQLFETIKVFEAFCKILKKWKMALLLIELKLRQLVFCIVGDNLGLHYIRGYV